jgi:hypothetical protein
MGGIMTILTIFTINFEINLKNLKNKIKYRYIIFLRASASHCQMDVRFHLTIVILISGIQRQGKIKQLFKFDSSFDKLRQRGNEKLITKVSF